MQFRTEGTFEGSNKWESAITRAASLYRKGEDVRSEFSRDYNRMLHSLAYRRLKHKTQVFYATMNDHICTRIEHVQHVEAVSRTISENLGLNAELSVAIALGHDLGHAPFGHEGEMILRQLAQHQLGKSFWHEQNSLRVVDFIETLPNLMGMETNLNLTYGVRDGIISHCGEVDENGLFPRNEAIDLYHISRPNEFSPYTWEACVVKLADKIAYLGRDIEDALRLGILEPWQTEELKQILKQLGPIHIEKVVTTAIMHSLIINLCEQSKPLEGLKFDNAHFEMMNAIKSFNYQHIYRHPRIMRFNQYVALVINTLFEVLMEHYDGDNTLKKISSKRNQMPEMAGSFGEWLIKYGESNEPVRAELGYGNVRVYDLTKREDYVSAVLDYISLMSDQYALKLYQEVIHF